MLVRACVPFVPAAQVLMEIRDSQDDFAAHRLHERSQLLHIGSLLLCFAQQLCLAGPAPTVAS